MAESKMDLKTALDLAKAYHTRQVVPFLRLAEVLAVAADAESRADAAKRELQTAQVAIDAIRGAVPEEQARLEEFRETTRKGIANLKALAAQADADATATIKAVTDKRQQVETAHAAFLANIAAEREKVEREYAESVAGWQEKLRAAQEKHATFLRSLGV